MGKQRMDSQKYPHGQRYFSPAHHYLAKLSAAAVTLVLILLAVVGRAAATIVYVSDYQEIPQMEPMNLYFFLDYNGEGVKFGIYLEVNPNPTFPWFHASIGGTGNANIATNLLKTHALNLGLNTPINGSLTWDSVGIFDEFFNTPPFSGLWAGQGKGYVGLQFSATDGIHYGWAELEVTSNLDVILYGYAYETEIGKSINAGNAENPGPGPGPVPVPGAVLLLGAGLMRLAAYRRRKSS